MSQIVSKHGVKLLLAILVVGVLALTTFAFTAGPASNTEPREILLTTRDVAFELPDQPGHPNPTIHIRKGEPIRLVVRNDEPGKVLHCFTIGGLNVKTSKNLSKGESETLAFTPNVRGTFVYACLMHPMMAGKLVVE